MDLISVYGDHSGYKVNVSKTQILTFNFIPKKINKISSIEMGFKI